MEILQRAIAKHPFFKNLDPSYLPFLTECAVEKEFEPGHYILHENEKADHFYLIRTGLVAVGTFVVGRGFTTIQTLGEGEILGWSWLIPPRHWHFNAMVVQTTSMIVLDGKRLREKCEEDHDFGYELMKRIAQTVGERLRATRMRLEI